MTGSDETDDPWLELELPMTKSTSQRIGVMCCAAPAFAAPCESLASLVLKDAKITSAQIVPAGQFSPPGGQQNGRGAASLYKDASGILPRGGDAHTEPRLGHQGGSVAADATGTAKFQAVGNGGWAGVISYSAMAEAVRAGYAAASTDTGHTGGGAAFVFGHPEKLIDFAWRSEHEMTVKAKTVIQTFYGSAPTLSYWNGCSTGGRQALKEAQMFPDDFDGIIAGAPANRTTLSLWIAHAVLKDPACYIPPAKYPVIHQAALAACDARDGLKDGLIDDPARARSIPRCCCAKTATVPRA